MRTHQYIPLHRFIYNEILETLSSSEERQLIEWASSTSAKDREAIVRSAPSGSFLKESSNGLLERMSSTLYKNEEGKLHSLDTAVELNLPGLVAYHIAQGADLSNYKYKSDLEQWAESQLGARVEASGKTSAATSGIFSKIGSTIETIAPRVGDSGETCVIS